MPSLKLLFKYNYDQLDIIAPFEQLCSVFQRHRHGHLLLICSQSNSEWQLSHRFLCLKKPSILDFLAKWIINSGFTSKGKLSISFWSPFIEVSKFVERFVKLQFDSHQWIQGYFRKAFCWFSRKVYELETNPIPIFASSFQGHSDELVKFSLRT